MGCSRLISRVLYPLPANRKRTSVICLIGLPPDIRRVVLNRRYTWPFNPEGRRPLQFPARPVGFYPTFSPLSLPDTSGGDGSSLFCTYTFTGILFSRGLAPFVARTFLPPKRATERPAALFQCLSNSKNTSVAPYPYSRNEASWYLASGN